MFFRYVKEIKKETYQNVATKELSEIQSLYTGYASGNMFSGIQSIRLIDIKGNEVKETKFVGKPPISRMAKLLSQLCEILPLLAITILITGVILLVSLFSQNAPIALLSLPLAIVLNLIISIVCSILETYFLATMPRSNQWEKALIGDDGQIAVADRATGRIVPSTLIDFEGEKHVDMLTEEQASAFYNIFFEKKK